MKKKAFVTIAVIILTGLILFVAVDKVYKKNLFPVIHSTIEGKSKNEYKINPSIKNGIYQSSIELAKNNTWVYDKAYYKLSYPGGDVPSGGACTDVVIRVLRKNNMDLQQLIHEDMVSNFSEYPKKWGLNNTDPNIDHRRVPNIMKYFERKGYGMSITKSASDYQPGDIVTWELSPGVTHIGIILENQDVFHNMGPTSRIERGFLFSHRIIGHYRI